MLDDGRTGLNARQDPNLESLYLTVEVHLDKINYAPLSRLNHLTDLYIPAKVDEAFGSAISGLKLKRLRAGSGDVDAAGAKHINESRRCAIFEPGVISDAALEHSLQMAHRFASSP